MTTEIHPAQTRLVESTLGMRERDFYIDGLRSVIIVLVVLLHTAITYGASGLWFYHELPSSAKPSSVILTLFCATNQAYIMGILFLLAGYFTPGSLERKSLCPLSGRPVSAPWPAPAGLRLDPRAAHSGDGHGREGQGILVGLRLALEPQGIHQRAALV